MNGFTNGLGNIHLLSNAKTRSISAENPNGKPGGGAMETPQSNEPAGRLGKGWKVRPYMNLEKDTTYVLADIEGPGEIQHIWLTVRKEAYRDCILRIYWDHEEQPSVEVPLGDFFANGHGLRYNVNSLPVSVNPVGGFNCYWPMPFRKHCKITIENQHLNLIDGFYYQINYALTEVADNAAYFHAQWRRSVTDKKAPEHVLVDAIKGKGHYVGTFLAWTQLSNGWWGEGEIKFFMDGDKEYPTICGTGTEDYFGGAWCFGDETYSGPYLGYPLYSREPGEVPKHGLYRWHIMDPIRFEKELKVTIQALGWWPDKKFQPLQDDIASVAFWYQSEPHTTFPAMPPVEDRWPR